MKKYIISALLFISASAVLAEEDSSSNALQIRGTNDSIPALVSYGNKHSVTVSTTYTFVTADENPESLLCFAALTSEQEFEAIRNEYFSDVKSLEEEIRCNNMTLARFRKKFSLPPRLTAAR